MGQIKRSNSSSMLNQSLEEKFKNESHYDQHSILTLTKEGGSQSTAFFGKKTRSKLFDNKQKSKDYTVLKGCNNDDNKDFPALMLARKRAKSQNQIAYCALM